MTLSPARRVRTALAACLLAFGASITAAQGTAPVPLDDPAYAYLDRLDELGIVDSAVMGQRPYSYREMGRLVRATRIAAQLRPADEKERALIEGLLARLEDRIGEHPALRRAMVDEGRVVLNANNAVRRGLPRAANALPAHATIDPLALRRLGEPAVRGQSGALELLQRAEPTSWLAVHARERLDLRNGRDTTIATQHASVLEGSARARWRNVTLAVGREQIGWGSGETGGLFFAADAPALDELSLASDHPFFLPSVLRRVGPVSGTLVLANMGPSDVRSHSKLLAYKLSARPTRSLEVGATFQDHFGGEGGRTSPFFYRVIDFLPMIDIFRRHNYVDTTHVFDVDSDKLIGVDARWRLEQLGGVVVAGELLMDDFDVHRLMSILNYAGSHALSITAPRLGSPFWSLQLSATHMGPLTYTHADLSQGVTTRGRLLGNELGPDAKAFGAEVRWMPAPGTRLSFAGRSVVSSNVLYASGYDINGRWIVRKLSALPDELGEQAVGSIAVEPTSTTGVTVRAGVGRIRNAMFVGGRRHNYAVDVAVRWRP